jgi:uncharacterized protein YlxW (UPF0749 family)
MTAEEINLKSPDAMFATVLVELRSLQQAVGETRDIVRRLESRVVDLERENLAMRSKVVGGVIALSTVIGFVGWAIQEGIARVFLPHK